MRDNVGNPIWFSYINDGSGQRIDTIGYAYGAQQDAPASHQASIQFFYDLTTREDIIKTYVAGHEFVTQALLTSVSVRNGIDSGTVVRDYALTYEHQDVLNEQTRLVSVQESANGVALPATTFNWANNDGGYAAQGTTLSLQDRNYPSLSGYQYGDINGDGATDILWQSVDIDGGGDDIDHQLRYALSRNGTLERGLFANGSYKLNLKDSYTQGDAAARMALIDYNADGRQDVAVYNSQHSEWHVFLSVHNGSEWILSSNALDPGLTGEYVTFADVDSDGLVDAVELLADGTLKVRYLRAGVGAASSNQFYGFVAATILPIGNMSNNQVVNPRMRFTPAGDFNGDGLMEFYAQGRDISCEDVPAMAILEVEGNLISVDSDGAATSLLREYSVYNYSDCASLPRDHTDRQLVFGDVNGDGLTDILFSPDAPLDPEYRSYYLWINDGVSLESASSVSDLITGITPVQIDAGRYQAQPQLVD